MNCICDPSSLPRVFPDNLVYIMDKGRSNTVPKKKKYLGGRTELTTYPVANIEVFVSNEVDKAIFLEWWVTELNYGTESFSIKFPFFGIWKDWIVTAIGDEMKEEPSLESGTVKLSLKLVDDLQEAINTNICQECTAWV